MTGQHSQNAQWIVYYLPLLPKIYGVHVGKYSIYGACGIWMKIEGHCSGAERELV